METQNTKKIIEQLIEDLGGVGKVSGQINLHPLTIMRWGYRGRIPKKYLGRFKKQSPGSDWVTLTPLFKN